MKKKYRPEIRQIVTIVNDKGEPKAILDSANFQPFPNEEEVIDKLTVQIQEEIDKEILLLIDKENNK